METELDEAGMEIVDDLGAPAPEFDPVRGRRAWEVVAERAEALDLKEVASVSVKLHDAGLRGVFLGRWVNEPARRARFERLSEQDFDRGALGRLETLGWAAVYVRVEGLKAAALATNGVVPADRVAAAYELAKRMDSVVEYWLSDIPKVAIELAAIRQGRGHGDLATDLGRYADLYEEHEALVALDRKKYRPEDMAAARKLSGEILDAIAATQAPSQRVWAERQARVWTLLRRDYDDVLATARWLWRHEPHELRNLTSLHVPLQRRKKVVKPAAPAEPAPV